MSLKNNITVFTGIPWLRDHDRYDGYYASCVDHIRAQKTSAKVLAPWRTPPYSGAFSEGDKSSLYAIMDRMNAVIDKYMTTKASHLWMVDADVEVPPHALETLLRHDVDLASGVYPFHNFKKRFSGDKPCRAMMGGRMSDNPCGFFHPRDWNYMKEQVFGEEFPVSAGTGCMLVKRRVFNQWHPKLPLIRFDKNDGKCGADVYFWKRCQDAGFTARLDANVVCGHRPNYPLDKVDEWLASPKKGFK